MAATPAFGSAIRTGVGICTTANTDKSGATTAQIKDILTGVAAGTVVERIRLAADQNPADCTVTIFVHDGTAYRFYDDIDVGDIVASSATVAGFTYEKNYAGIYLPSTSFKLAASITATTTAGSMYVWGHGYDLT